MLTRIIFIIIIAVIVLQRTLEIHLSYRNALYILSQGGQEHSNNLLNIVKMLQVSWLLAMIVEVLYLNRPFIPALAAGALLATITGQVLRYLSMHSLGWRWTLTIMTISHLPVVDSGIYRHLRHPNWLGVTLEIAGLPLIHGAYFTASFFSLANVLLMIKRIESEEHALSKNTNYGYAFADKPRFIPNCLRKSRR